MIPMIIRVWCDGSGGTYMPVTPVTTCRDVIECCRDPGDEKCHLLKVDQDNTVEVLHEDDKPLDILLSEDKAVQFILRYAKTGSRSSQTSDVMKESGTFDEVLPEGVELTLGELRAMALRQQQQIDCQHQLLAAREQRLRFLKHQEARHHQVAAENERLRRLRERVEAQELKLRRLRALRGQLDQTNLNNVALTSDLESIRALFNEKEKELSVAVAKVEELTRQLEEVRRGRAPPRAQPPAALELDKLRRELMYRNKLNEQQNARLSQQREALTARQAEMASIDQRISELQGRLHRKRVANRQLKHQPRSGNSAPVQLSNYPNSGSGGNNGGIKPQGPRGNVAAVEPYNHIPHPQNMQHAHNIQALKHNAAQNNHPIKLANQGDVIGSHLTQQEAHYLQQKQFTNQVYANGAYQQRLQGNLLQNDNQNNQGYPGKNSDITGYPGQQNDQKNLLEHIKYNVELQKNALTTVNHNQVRKSNVDQETIPEFAASKSDPKYQTLPYNTKFTSNSKAKQFYDESKTNEHGIVKVSSSSNLINLNHMTAHSTPLTISKGLATPLSPNDGNSGYHGNEMLQGYHKSEAGYHGNDVGGNSSSGYQLQRSESGGVCNEDKENQGHVREGKEQGKAQGGRAELVRGFSQQSTVTSTGQMKPVSSVAPTSVQVSSGKPSPIYQTSSTKIQPVQPQTVVSSVGAGARGVLSPQGSSTPETADKQVPRPALPPKPPAKLQPSSHESSPASSQSFQDSSREPAVPPVPTSDPPNDQQTNNNLSPNPATSSEGQPMIIKARPLTIKKQPLSEQPKLRNQSSSIVKSNASVMTTSRRAEMSSAFEANQEFNKSNKLSNNNSSSDVTDRMVSTESETSSEDQGSVGNITDQMSTVDLSNGNGEGVVRRIKKGNLKQTGRMNLSRRVSFDPLALLLDASLEGELELVKKTATQVANPSAANDEGITALHNAICAGHFEIVKFLVEFGCDVNAQDSDGWTPLHCAASCNNVAMVRFLVENGACIFATTLSDHETAAQKCEEDEEGFDGCSEYLYSVQEKLGIMNGGCVYAVFAYTAQEPDELSFPLGARLGVLRKGDEAEREWWWARHAQEGYVPRNLLGLYPRVTPPKQEQ